MLTQKRTALAISGAILLLSGCADISTGPYQASGQGRESGDAGIYDEGGLYEPGLDDGGIDEDTPRPLTGDDGLIDDKAL